MTNGAKYIFRQYIANGGVHKIYFYIELYKLPAPVKNIHYIYMYFSGTENRWVFRF